MLGFLSNLGPVEIIVVAVVAILVFGKNLPEAAAKAFVQIRKLRNAVEDLKRDTGIDRELRDIQRSVREAEWEARRPVPPATLPRTSSARTAAATVPEPTTEAPAGNVADAAPEVPPPPPAKFIAEPPPRRPQDPGEAGRDA